MIFLLYSRKFKPLYYILMDQCGMVGGKIIWTWLLNTTIALNNEIKF